MKRLNPYLIKKGLPISANKTFFTTSQRQMVTFYLMAWSGVQFLYT